MSAREDKRLVDGGGQGQGGESDRDAAWTRALLERVGAEESLPGAGNSNADAAELAARERVWRRLGAAGKARRPRWQLAATGATAFALVALAFASLRGADRNHAGAPMAAAASNGASASLDSRIARQPEITLTEGALSSPAGSSVHEIVPGGALANEQVVRTGAVSSLIHIDQIADVLVQPESHLAIDTRSGQTVIHLAQGEVVAQVSPRAPGQEFLVEVDPSAAAGHLEPLRVRVVGTILAVRASAQSTRVSVSRGVVQVEQGVRITRVEAGHSWSSAAPQVFSADTISPADRARVEQATTAFGHRDAPAQAQAGSPAQDASAARPAAAAPTAQPGAIEERGAVNPERASPRSSMVNAARPLPARTSTSDAPSEPSSPPRAKSVATPTTGAPAAGQFTPVPPPEIAAGPRVAVIEDGDPYRKAERLLARGQPAQAAEAFAAIVQNHGAHQDLALYELGRIRQRDLGDPAGALQAFRRYRKEFPGGALTQEVELSVIDLELGSQQPGDRAAALFEISQFLRDNPDSERTAELHLLRGNLRREKGECEPAIADYREATFAFAGDALYFTAFCQQRLGRLEDAKASLRDYLRRFPTGGHRAEAQAALDAARGDPEK